jgi:hypothetical protein
VHHRHSRLHIQRIEFSPVLIGKSEELVVSGPRGSRGEPRDPFLYRHAGTEWAGINNSKSSNIFLPESQGYVSMVFI